MKVVRSDGGKSEWDGYVAAHPRATQYHDFEWMEILAGALRHRFVPLLAKSGSDVVGVFPLILVRTRLFGCYFVSLPIANYSGVLADDVETERLLWEEAGVLAGRAGASHVEARHLAPHPFVEHSKQHKATMILDLAPSVEAQWKALDAKVRNQTRKSEKSGLTARVAAAEGLEAFYSVLSVCKRDLGAPVWSRELFDRVFRAYPNSARIVLVEDGDTTVAAGVALRHRDVVEVPWAGSLREHWAKSPNNKLYWELIQYAIKSGARRFDFGRSTPGDGPYRFKEQWGSRPIPLYWEYWLPSGDSLPDFSPTNWKFQFASTVWKHLPVSTTRWLGPALARGLPS